MRKHPDSNRIIPIERDNPSISRNTDLCINCGQCANVCPVEAITEKYDYLDVRSAIKDPDKVVILSTSSLFPLPYDKEQLEVNDSCY